jgi:phosphatidylserine/phosphatidylglycerophosphate/cardiolipin synthase-like enzyme
VQEPDRAGAGAATVYSVLVPDADRQEPAPGGTGDTDPPWVGWLLTKAERANAQTVLDDIHPGQQAWSHHNHVRPLVHGVTYFAELFSRIEETRRGDLILFTDWRGDPDELLIGNDPQSTVVQLLGAADRRGVDVRGLIWRSHWDKLSFSGAENRQTGEQLQATGAEALLDMRVRNGGSHHQKLVVIRYTGAPERDVAFVGGIDLCHSRRDDARHLGDPQAQSMAKAYGKHPAWHDIQAAITGPAVYDVETVFRERWMDPTPLSRNPWRRLNDKAIERAERLIYVEDQYLWSAEVAATFADALRAKPELRVIAVLPHLPDQSSLLSKVPQELGRHEAINELWQAGPGRVACYGIENHHGLPVYVHAKVCVIDDIWATIGSDNFNRRSWTHDSELSVVVIDTAGGDHSAYARRLRLTLAAEHLDRRLGPDEFPGDISVLEAGRTPEELNDRLLLEVMADCVDPRAMFDAFAAAGAALQGWHDGGCTGERPPGRLRPLARVQFSPLTRAWAWPLYRLVHDPDGRPRALRRRRAF